jgi:hypothetical protein
MKASLPEKSICLLITGTDNAGKERFYGRLVYLLQEATVDKNEE